MKKNHIPLATTILFFVCVALVLGYLLAMRLHFPLPTAVFWAAIFMATLAIVFQITQIPWPGYEGLLLVEILILGIALHAVYQIPFYGIYDSDSYENMLVIRQILDQGVIMTARPDSESIIYWPLLKTHGAQLHYLTGITTFNIAKWLSPIMSSIFILLMYVLVKRVFKSGKVALLTILLMVTLQHFTFLGSKFHSENIALIIMMTGLFWLTRTAGSKAIKYGALSILCLLGVIFAHHLTPLMLVIFLFISLAVYRILGSPRRKLPMQNRTLMVTVTFAVLAFVAMLSFWMYRYDEPLVAMAEMGRLILLGHLGIGTGAEQMGILEPQTIPSLRGQITFYGYYFFLAVFGAILLYKVFLRPKDKYPEFYSFASFLFLCGFIVILRMYLLPAGPLDIPSDRLFTWGWIFGFAPLVISMLENRSNWGRKVGMTLLAGFMIFSIFTLPRNTWDFKEPGIAAGDIALKEDYAVAETLALSPDGAAYHNTRLAIYDVRGFFCRDLAPVPDVDKLEALDWIVIKKRQLLTFKELRTRYPYSEAVVDRLTGMLTESSPGSRNRIYDSNNIAVLK